MGAEFWLLCFGALVFGVYNAYGQYYRFAATLLVLRFIDIPPLSARAQAAPGRPLREIASQPKFIVAVMSGAIGYGVMNFLMTSTPIAMGVCGHPYGDAAFVISSHVIAMFAPSFVTGRLIQRFGVLQVMFTGALLNFATVGIALAGIAVAKAQGANDQVIFIMMAISSFTSGLTVTAAGWERVNLFALPMVAVVAIAILWYGMTRPRRGAA